MKNPHAIFILISIFSFLITTIMLLIQERFQELLSMLTTFLIVLSFLAIILFVTRKYWIGARGGM